ncbi:hypothetical protein Misp01_46150 [Microtetraspora sp. NBRC 13810]|uniref:hypothetical protein n=1 Tax=Microtetraspora sp. NBRC 13810 TaxID=3030990 RepID=UPI0024A3DE85|nr:hypothetical protein [Microtetraspora sp. NBRC 13810]GLW09486.1 hypothetical protein Misp01_46150 [Microtetraspora sp. NBRC 13810]
MAGRKHALFGAGVAGVGVPAILVAAAFHFRDRLPEPLATHWSGTAPDGAMSFAANLTGGLVLWAVGWVTLLGIALHGQALARRANRVCWWGFLAFWGGLALGVQATVLAANLDVPVWSEASIAWWSVIATLAGAVGLGALAGYLGRGEPDGPDPAGDRPVLRLRPGQRAVWVGRVTNRWLIASTCVFTLMLAVVGFLGAAGFVGGVAVAGLIGGGVVLVAGLLTSAVTVRITETGLTIGFGPLGWPVRRIGLSKIEDARAETLCPSQVGGWGLRGVPGSSAIMLRGGQCLVLRFRSGGRLVISIDDAESGAALLNTFIAERAA